MRADINAIILGFEGHIDDLKAIYGSAEKEDEEPVEELRPGMLRQARFG